MEKSQISISAMIRFRLNEEFIRDTVKKHDSYVARKSRIAMSNAIKSMYLSLSMFLVNLITIFLQLY